MTTEDAEGKTAEEYADDYYDYNGYAEDGVLYLIDLDNGSVWISTAGKMIRYLTDARIDAVIDAGYDNLKAKNYADGILEMLNETESYLEDGSQKIGEGVFGKSITDPCLGWEKTEALIYSIAEQL